MLEVMVANGTNLITTLVDTGILKNSNPLTNAALARTLFKLLIIVWIKMEVSLISGVILATGIRKTGINVVTRIPMNLLPLSCVVLANQVLMEMMTIAKIL